MKATLGRSANPVKMIARALEFAARAHAMSGDPFTLGCRLRHLSEVARLLAEATDGDDPIVVTAGILHDVVYKALAPIQDVEARFGHQVALLVEEANSLQGMIAGAGLHDENVIRRRLELLPSRPAKVRMVIIADHTSEAIAIAKSRHDIADPIEAGLQIEQARRSIDVSRSAHSSLAELFDKAYVNAMDRLNKTAA